MDDESFSHSITLARCSTLRPPYPVPQIVANAAIANILCQSAWASEFQEFCCAACAAAAAEVNGGTTGRRRLSAALDVQA